MGMTNGVPFERVLYGAVVGLVGGLVGSWAMNQVPTIVGAFQEKSSKDDAGERRQQDEPSTVKVARGVSQTLIGHDLPRGTEGKAANAVHFAFGGVMGAAYGALTALTPAVSAGHGLLWGIAVWAVADEAALPLLGLSAPPTEHPASSHAMSLAGHCVYGVTSDLVRRALRA